VDALRVAAEMRIPKSQRFNAARLQKLFPLHVMFALVGKTVLAAVQFYIQCCPSHQLKIMATCAYGIDAIRSQGRGANTVGILMQWDLGKPHFEKFNPAQPNRWRGWQWPFANQNHLA
jgi:hypothetical protein